MMNIPCEECPVLAICRNKVSVTETLKNCNKLVSGIDCSDESIIELIETLNPIWFKDVDSAEMVFNVLSIKRNVYDMKSGRLLVYK